MQVLDSARTKIKSTVKSNPRLLHIARKLARRKYKIIQITDQISLTRDWCNQLPNVFQCAISIPRSGVMIANVISLRFGVGWATIDGFLRKEVYGAQFNDIKHVLIVDDGVATGNALNLAKEKIQKAYPNIHVSTGALFARENSVVRVDYVYKRLNRKEVGITMEWDFITDPIRNCPNKPAADLDGFLCHDLPPCKSQAEYIEAIKTASPFLIPKYPLSAIITSRNENVRVITEEWLKQHGVKYDKLVMAPNGYINADDSASFKVGEIKKCNPSAYYESDKYIAGIVKKQTHVLTYCAETSAWVQ
jgi:hypoxanthine phosphoribosyltransferase